MRPRVVRGVATRPELLPHEAAWLAEQPPERVARFWDAFDAGMVRDTSNTRGLILEAAMVALGGWPL